MKSRTIGILAVSFFTLLFSCSREYVPDMMSGAVGSLSVSVDGFETKAATEGNRGREGVLNSVRMLMFNSSGELYRYNDLSSVEIAAGSVTVSDVNVGDYTVAIVANGPDLSTVRTLTSLNAITTMLDGYNVTTSGFLMTGIGKATVKEDVTATLNVILTHHVARVKVSRITNSLPPACGSLTVNSIMLTNVYGTWLLMGGKPSSAVWYNREGRDDGSPRVSSHIIDGSSYLSSCPDLLWRKVAEDIASGLSDTTTRYLYAYPNDATAAPNGFRQPFNAQRTCVVLSATLNSGTCYYPVVLDGALQSNKSYDVQYTIKGYGSSDPNKPVASGTMNATVTVEDWAGTKTYTDNI